MSLLSFFIKTIANQFGNFTNFKQTIGVAYGLLETYRELQ